MARRGSAPVATPLRPYPFSASSYTSTRVPRGIGSRPRRRAPPSATNTTSSRSSASQNDRSACAADSSAGE
eukprot:107301-Chlamydomonas_euryale.AAC.1